MGSFLAQVLLLKGKIQGPDSALSVCQVSRALLSIVLLAVLTQDPTAAVWSGLLIVLATVGVSPRPAPASLSDGQALGIVTPESYIHLVGAACCGWWVCFPLELAVAGSAPNSLPAEVHRVT